MRIVIDIAHPAHVHYYRNFIKIMSSRGHEFLVTARNKEHVYQLLNSYGIPFIKRGSEKKGALGTLRYAISSIKHIYRAASKFNPDLFLDMGTIFASPVAKLMGKPYIAMDDTEVAFKARFIFMPFADYILTPTCFYKDLGKKQIRFNSYMELAYLAPKYFTPDPSILKNLGMKQNEKFIIIRFVSWEAHHDVGVSGITKKYKIKVVKEFSKFAKVLISSELHLPSELEEYKFQLPPEKIHDALYYAAMVYGESATMASESAVLGTPAIFIDKYGRGYTTEEEKKYNMVFNFTNSLEDQEKSITKGIELIKPQKENTNEKSRNNKILQDKIDVTAFLIWFIENYPESARIMKENPDYQYRFRQH